MTTYNGLQLPKEIETFLRETGETSTIKKGTFLFSEGEIADKLYILKSGLIRIGKLTSDGKEISLRICDEGDLVGEISLFSEDLKYILNAKVLEDGEVITINKSKLEKKLLKNPYLTIELIQIMNKSIRRDQMRLYDLISNGKKGALYSTLIRLSNSYGKPHEKGILLDISLTNQELANFCGTARESVSRLLNELKQKKIISDEQSQIIIHDIDYLKAEINCEYCPVVLCTIH